jgi:NAD(P)H-nitrite reductase large subunit
MGVDLFCAGHPEPRPDEEEIVSLDSRSGRYRKLVLVGDRLAGALLIGDLAEVPVLHDLIEHDRPIPPGLLDGPPAEHGVPAPPTALVCSCNGVSREEIERAIVAGGLERIEQVAAATAASTGCGGCRPGVEALLAQARERVREPLPG